MALNFPANPTTGDQYTAEGVTYQFFENRWVIDTATENAPVEIVGADITKGWQVWGDVLIQVGAFTSNSSADSTVIFNQPFKIPPQLVLQYLGPPAGFIAQASAPTATGFDARVVDTAAANRQEQPLSWIAIGEAPDALKKPKEIGVAYGGAAAPDYDLLDQRYVRNETEGGGLVTISTDAPSGGEDGDIWFTVT